MKKYIGIIISFLLFVATGITHTATTASAVAPVEPVLSQQTSPSVSDMASPSGEMKPIEYTLPYPGILPDHPLYNLKRFRDYVLERLISDPVRKAEFYTLQGDKRLGMGIALFGKGNGILGETTISKGEKYMEKAVSGLSTMKAQNAAIPPHVLGNMEKSLAKHKEVIMSLLTSASDAEKAGLEGSLKLIEQMIQTTAGLKQMPQ